MAKEYGLAFITISTIINPTNKAKISKLLEFNQITDKCKSLKSTSYPDIEEALILWFTNIKKLKNITVSGIELQAKALEFAQKFKHPEFKASCGSLDNLKKKNSICWKTNVGEAGLVDQEEKSLGRCKC